MKCKNSCDSRSFIQVGICILILGHFLRKREYIPHTLYALTFFPRQHQRSFIHPRSHLILLVYKSLTRLAKIDSLFLVCFWSKQ